MTQYAHYISETEITHPRAEEFKGIPNWTSNDSAMRKRGYVPLTDVPAPQEGKHTLLDGFEFVQRTKTRVEPRPYVVEDWEEREDPETHEKTREKTGEHTEWRDTEITLDDSYIKVTQFHYEELPPPEPEPEPVVRYSKYALKNACVERGLWEQVKAMIEAAGKWESFLLIQDLSSDNAELQEVLPAIKERFGADVVEAVLAESILS